MVTNVKMKRIVTGETPVQELQRKLTEEKKELAKAAALELGCPVEEIKYRINNMGIYEFQRMTPEEMIELTAYEQAQKQKIDIKKRRGVL